MLDHRIEFSHSVSDMFGPIHLSVFLLLVALPLLLPAGEPTSDTTQIVDLDQSGAVQLAVAKNLSIQAGLIPPAIASEAIRVEAGVFDPLLDLQFNKTELNNAVSSDPLTPANPSKVRIDEYSGAIRGQLPWGGTYDLGIDLQNRRSTIDRFRDEYSATVGAGLTLPILQGFGTDVNLAPIRIARRQAASSQWEFRQVLIDTITDTIVAYNNLYFSQEGLKVAVRSQALAQQLLEDNIRRAEIGVMSPLDITTARAEVASREEEILVARRAVRDNENLLKQLVTGEVEQILTLTLNISPPALSVPLVREVRLAFRKAIELRPDYRQALLELENNRIRLVVDQNAVLPTLDLVASYGLNGLDTSLDQTFEQITKADFASWAVGVNFSMPIPNRTATSQRRISELSIEESLLLIKRLEQTILVELDNDLGEIETARERIEASRVATMLAAESLQAEQEKLRAGSSTTFNVLELQRNLAEAQADQLRALLDYNNAVAEFHQSAGLTLQANDVALGAEAAAEAPRPEIIRRPDNF